MSGIFTKSMARNIFYGGTVFFFLLFLALTFDTERELPLADDANRALVLRMLAQAGSTRAARVQFLGTALRTAPRCRQCEQRLRCAVAQLRHLTVQLHEG